MPLLLSMATVMPLLVSMAAVLSLLLSMAAVVPLLLSMASAMLLLLSMVAVLPLLLSMAAAVLLSLGTDVHERNSLRRTDYPRHMPKSLMRLSMCGDCRVRQKSRMINLGSYFTSPA